MVKEVNMTKMLEDATENFTTGFMCSESVLEVLNRHYELGIGEEAIALSTGFPYGFGDGGNVCGAVAGATMCLGKVFGRTVKGDPAFKSVSRWSENSTMTWQRIMSAAYVLSLYMIMNLQILIARCSARV